jgi:hypothetical protein
MPRSHIFFEEREVACILQAVITYGPHHCPPNDLKEERLRCPQLEAIIARHGGVGSVNHRWNDVRALLEEGRGHKRGVTSQVIKVLFDNRIYWEDQPGYVSFGEFLDRASSAINHRKVDLQRGS